MKKLILALTFTLAFCLHHSQAATIFTNSISINPWNTSHDGDDIIISNCTVTVDGAHGFNSVLVAAGGVLTHTAATNGSAAIYFTTTNELTVLTGTNAITLVNSNVAGLVALMNAGRNVFSNGVDFIQMALANGQMQLARTATSSIPDGATVLATYTWGVTFNPGLRVTVTNDLTVAVGGSIVADGLGFGSGLGTGAGHSATSAGQYYDGTGAGHGGNGGLSASSLAAVGTGYDNLYMPTNLGSGGGRSYAGDGGGGGGKMLLVAGGVVTINGTLSANGSNASNSRAGGGAGGSIWINAATFAGSGRLAANGGNGDSTRGGGGGGGMISIQCGTNTFFGNLTAYGGTGCQGGGAGTVFVQTNSQPGLLRVDNNGRSGAVSSPALTNSDVIISGAAIVVPSSTFWPNNLTIATNSFVLAAKRSILFILVASNLTIQAGGAILADGAGYLGGTGEGAGSYVSYIFACGGGAHGGNGAAVPLGNLGGGASYGSQSMPTSFGSGGGANSVLYGGDGGGAILLSVAGTLLIDGRISANANDGSGGGGGAGGSICLSQCSLLTGTGNITADGGDGDLWNGGGGGGRIAIYAATNMFAGAITAYGGGPVAYGGAGTIYLQTSASSQLLLDNGGHAGTNTVIQSASTATLTVRNGAVAAGGSALNFASLNVSSNSWLMNLQSSPLSLTISNDATIQSGGGFFGDGMGRIGGQGTGTGGSSSTNSYPCGGGGYGGKGGNSYYFGALGGVITGDTAAIPSATYSGSGGGSSTYSYGGSGGGFFQLNVSGTLQLDGIISANGIAGDGLGGGGGAGGGVYLNAGTLSGSGGICANGGAGVRAVGGGGGGGRIALYFNNYNFTGTLSAAGGSGFNYGGGGTIFLKTNSVNTAQVIVDNAENTGAETIWNSSSTMDLILRNNSGCRLTTASSFHNLTVGSNCWVVVSNSAGNITITASNVAVLAGGNISADFCGAPPNYGTGPGRNAGSKSPYYACSGAGHGGTGGQANTNYLSSISPPGAIYDSIISPKTVGSGGGDYAYFGSFGGYGGGAIVFSIAGNLQVNGTISANGGNGSGLGGGGGSGGSINISCGSFSGGGLIAANGGSGVAGIGGGGAGGMIACSFNTNSFAGALNAFAGGGATYGGAGTIYLRNNSANNGQLIIDNAGHAGGVSAIITSGGPDVTLQNSALSYLSGTASFGNLVIISNAALVVSNGSSAASLSLNAANVTVLRGGILDADLSGDLAATGSGRGNSFGALQPYYACSGAGHGGYGATGNSNLLSGMTAGGSPFDSAANPSVAGSGGGSYSPTSVGGRGGGAITLSLTGTLLVDGLLSANAGDGTGLGGGGGSGGSLNISCVSFLGSGCISANGGAGAVNVGGGGAGGMIAMNFTSNLFSGTVSATGGGGGNYGGAGTTYFRTNSTGQSALVIDNGNHRGANTPIVPATSLVVRNRAAAVTASSSQYMYSSLLMASNALLGPSPVSSTTVNLVINGDVTIQTGSSISADACGNPQNGGSGRGGHNTSDSPIYRCGGAGHGGYGATGYYDVNGGNTYDSMSVPNAVGGGGGGYSTSIGGTGGGLVQLTVNGTLQLDGAISANAGNGSGGGGGGGAGGSIFLNVNRLRGAGILSANGGNGALYGGGGGGGRIALYCASNDFSGKLAAYGGGGTGYGGAGTVYVKSAQAVGQLILDNANNAGANSTFDFLDMDVVVQNHAIGTLPTGLWSAHDILIHTNGTLKATNFASSSILACNNLTVDDGGALTLNGIGGSSTGNGYASGSFRGGGGHGGFGGANPPGSGLAYDSITAPALPGSSGASYQFSGGTGGGALRLSVTGTLSVNGQLTANGGNGYDSCGGGAGGSLYLTNINLLTGSGTISANGGTGGTGPTGGGGGGRIALYCNSNIFTGTLCAAGGNGLLPGGAGTVFTRLGNYQRLLLDNMGLVGTNTPLDSTMPVPPLDLVISGAGSAVCTTPLPLLSNLTVAAGSTLTMLATQSLYIAVQNNANIGGSVTVDSLGYGMTNGPGSGIALGQQGSGGGYGSAGGNSASGASGGTTYGSASRPTDFGSGGGNGVPTVVGGSEGGGALHLTVGGTLDVAGNISADGDLGWQDNSGGGAGGSVWITANTLTGAGTISAVGGDGESNGGGGGGGRIAIYAPTNLFAGITNLNGGLGAMNGQPGTLFLSGTLLNFMALTQSPTGTVNNTVGYVDVSFSDAVDPASLAVTNFTFTTPSGTMDSSHLSVSTVTPSTVRVSFPTQNLLGNYSLQTGTGISNLFGQALAAPFTGGFAITLPTVSGTVTDTNGAPLAGVTVQPDGGLIGSLTGANGSYVIGVPPGWNGALTPSLGTSMFVPGALSFTNVTQSLANQNFVLVPTLAPTLASSVSSTNLSLGWFGIQGVTYQAWYSTNLVNWLPYGNPISGSNSTLQVSLPEDGSPSVFFRIGATH